jgi:hypothetical protein
VHNAQSPIPADDLRENITCQMQFVPKSWRAQRFRDFAPSLYDRSHSSFAAPRSGDDSLFEEAIGRAPLCRAHNNSTPD